MIICKNRADLMRNWNMGWWIRKAENQKTSPMCALIGPWFSGAAVLPKKRRPQGFRRIPPYFHTVWEDRCRTQTGQPPHHQDILQLRAELFNATLSLRVQACRSIDLKPNTPSKLISSRTPGKSPLLCRLLICRGLVVW